MKRRTTQLQRVLEDAWRSDSKRCEREGFPRTTKGLDAWQLLTLETALNVPIGSTPRPKEPKGTTVPAHRDALRAARKAVEDWAARYAGERDELADAVIERLGECATDTDGDETLDVVGELFEEHVDQWAKDSARALIVAMVDLSRAAHAMGRVRSVGIVRGKNENG